MLNFSCAVSGSKKLNSKDDWPELTKTSVLKNVSKLNELKTKVELLEEPDEDKLNRRFSLNFPKLLDESLKTNTKQVNEPKKVKSISAVEKYGNEKMFKMQTCKTKKKINPRTQPLNVDVYQAIQDSLLRKKIRNEPIPRRKIIKTVRRPLTNCLDSDLPIRRKGKVRLGKRKHMTVTKRVICESRKLNLEKMHYPPVVVTLKQEVSNLLKLGSLTSQELESSFQKLTVIDQKEETEENYVNIEHITKAAQAVVHTKKFKKYCKNLPTKDLKAHVSELIISLRKFQDKLYARDEIKAHAKRRYVCGFNETKKFVLCNKIKLVIVATNLEIDEELPSSRILKDLGQNAYEKNIPIVYGALAEEIGYWTLKKRKISVIGILDYDGARETFRNLISSWEKAKQDYEYLIGELKGFLSAKATGHGKEVNLNRIEKELRDKIISKLSTDRIKDEQENCV